MVKNFKNRENFKKNIKIHNNITKIIELSENSTKCWEKFAKIRLKIDYKN